MSQVTAVAGARESSWLKGWSPSPARTRPAQGTWSEECEGLLSEHGGLELGRLCRADGLWLKVCAEYRASVITAVGPSLVRQLAERG